MEHVKDSEKVYKAIHRHLGDENYTLHDIELHSHGLTKKMAGHYSISPWIWKLITGRRKYFLNRWPLDDHLRILNEVQLQLIDVHKNIASNKNNTASELYGATLLAQRD